MLIRPRASASAAERLSWAIWTGSDWLWVWGILMKCCDIVKLSRRPAIWAALWVNGGKHTPQKDAHFHKYLCSTVRLKKLLADQLRPFLYQLCYEWLATFVWLWHLVTISNHFYSLLSSNWKMHMKSIILLSIYLIWKTDWISFCFHFIQPGIMFMLVHIFYSVQGHLDYFRPNQDQGSAVSV